MAGRHRELVEEVRQTLGYARGAARAAVTEAEDRAAKRRADHAAVEREAHRAGQRLLAAHATRRGAVDRQCLARLTAAAEELTALADEQARGAAGAPWDGWAPTPPARDESPGLYRIGRLTARAAVPGPAEPDVPALVGLLDAGHLLVEDPGHDRLPAVADDPAPPVTHRPTDRVHALVGGLLLRVLGSTAPGAVRLTVYDPERLGGSLASFAPLASADLLTFVGPGGLGGVLDELVEEIRRINETVLAGEYRSLRELHAATGRRPEPWRVAVLLGEGWTPDGGGAELTAAQQAQLDRVIRTGPACGVHLVVSGVGPAGDWCEHPLVDRIVLWGATAWTTATGNRFLVQLDPPPGTDLATGTCRAIAEKVLAGPDPAVFADLLPAETWTGSSAERLVAPVGAGPDGRLVDVELGDSPPHALIGGPSGAGKTNLLYAWLGSLAARYSPDELALYLLDFKEGVSFARFAPGRRDPSWLPHVRLVGVNVNADREYGLALLAFLHDELRRRAEAAKAHEATKLSELRAEDPDGHWPRIVAVIDEFQVLLDGRDPVALEAARLLEDLARRGRSQGIHLVLASQDLSGIDALWGRASMVAQFTLRIALPKARRILAEGNLAADTVPRHHAVVNPDSGATPANRVAHIPDAGSRGTLDALQQALWRRLPADTAPPVLFDGGRVPRLAEATELAELAPDEPGGRVRAPVALVGRTIDVTGRSAAVRLSRSPGRNLAVLGARGTEACDVLATAALSLGRQYRAGGVRFSLACLDDDAVDATKQVLDELRVLGHDADWYDRDGVCGLLAAAAADLGTDRAPDTRPHILLLYAVDAASSLLERKDPATRRSARDDLKDLVARGPEQRTHVVGWWRSVPRLRDDLGGVGARLDAFGAWVALDVQGPDLAPLSTQPGGPAWYPRTRRALFFDRAVHRRPVVVIPYDTTEAP
ncbi:FtsK/SpoIIIE domain-containing protein [Actinocatenispora rupis]|uniref:Cell division protein FtsK n=1 Tax=Actinocatenispora rupis TaxID=519421 RepID=A0A8J3J9Z0_9ACTN|nr:FtsK/SpoIIIE domain-containing protein [Actinocatenispora rupis]GID12789.1 cell division protein FtsK [Actinocatenispora rupis]